MVPSHILENSESAFLGHPVLYTLSYTNPEHSVEHPKYAFAGYREIFWTAPTSSASHPKSSVHNVSQVITAFMQQTDSCAHFVKSSGIENAQK